MPLPEPTSPVTPSHALDLARMPSSALRVAALVVAGVVGCSPEAPPPDAPVDAGAVETDAPAEDAAAALDAPIDAAIADPRCDHEGFAWAYGSGRANASALEYVYLDTLADVPTGVLRLERYYELGAVRRDEPQFVTLRDESYADCSTCLLLMDDCSLGATVFDVGECTRYYLARAGQLEITIEGTAGEELLVFLHDVELVEVRIDPATLATTPVPGGETWCIDGLMVDTTRLLPWE